MKIAICDDEEKFLNSLEYIMKSVIEKEYPDVTIEKFTDLYDFMCYFEEHKDIDIVFMDILMRHDNGFDEAVKLREMDERIKIIFITAVTKYAIRGYDINATKYLVKPVSSAAIQKVLTDTIEQVISEKEAYIIEKNDFGVFKVFLSEIIFIETYNRNTIIHTTKNDVLSYKSMRSHLERLDSNFYRCHAAFIVNLAYVRSYKKNQVTLVPGDIVNVSKSKKKGFLEALTNYFGRYM